jgi:hypothetical protein
LCGCSTELSYCVGAVQNYHIVWVQCCYNIVWMQYSFHIVWVQCRVITLCGCSAELSHFVGAVQSYHIPSWNCVVQCITSQLFLKDQYVISKITLSAQQKIHTNRKTERWPRRLVPPVSSNRPQEFRLADPKNVISQTATFSSYRPENFILETPKFHLTNPRNFPQPTAALRRN